MTIVLLFPGSVAMGAGHVQKVTSVRLANGKMFSLWVRTHYYAHRDVQAVAHCCTIAAAARPRRTDEWLWRFGRPSHGHAGVDICHINLGHHPGRT